MGNLKNFENMLKYIENEKQDISDDDFENLNLCLKLLYSNKITIKWDTSIDNLSEVLGIDIDNNKESFKGIREGIEVMISWIAKNFEALFSCKMSEDIIYDKILITFLYAKLKSGLVLEINSKGINDYLKNVLNKK